MGLLDQMRQAHVEVPTAVEAAPAPELTAVEVAPAPAPAAPAPVVKTDLKFERDPGTGLIDTAVGYDRNGQKVRFTFERDGRRQLENIKVRR